MGPLKMYFLLKIGKLHCYVSLPEGILKQRNSFTHTNTCLSSDKHWREDTGPETLCKSHWRKFWEVQKPEVFGHWRIWCLFIFFSDRWSFRFFPRKKQMRGRHTKTSSYKSGACQRITPLISGWDFLHITPGFKPFIYSAILGCHV